MTQVKWLVESEIFEDDAKPLLETLKKQDIEHQMWFGHMYQEVKKATQDTHVRMLKYLYLKMWMMD